MENRANGIKTLGKNEHASKASLYWTDSEKKKNQCENFNFVQLWSHLGKLRCPVWPFILKQGCALIGEGLETIPLLRSGILTIQLKKFTVVLPADLPKTVPS